MVWLLASIVYVYQNENTAKKMLISIMLSNWLMQIGIFINTYLFNDWSFGRWLLLTIALDTGTGIWKSIKADGLKSLNMDKFKKMLEKLAIYGILLVVGHILVSYKASGKNLNAADSIRFTFYTAILTTELASIIVNMYHIRKDLVPRAIVERINLFNKSGKTEDLLPKVEQNGN